MHGAGTVQRYGTTSGAAARGTATRATSAGSQWQWWPGTGEKTRNIASD